MPSSRGSSQLRDRTQVSHIAGGFFTIGTTMEAHQGYNYSHFIDVDIVARRLTDSSKALLPRSISLLQTMSWDGEGEIHAVRPH